MNYPEYNYGYHTLDGYRKGRPVKVSDIPKEYEGEAYSLIVEYRDTILSHLDSGKKWTDYYGNRYARCFPMDIDLEGDLEKAKELIISFLEFISNEYEIDLSWVQIFFSGCKGFHILIPSILFDISPHRDLESKFKILAKRLISGHPIQKAGAVDLQFYSRNRWLRLPNSINTKSNLYKIPLTWNELTSLTIKEIQELAKAPRYIDNVISISELTPISSLAQMYQDCLETATPSSSIDVNQLLANGVSEGERGNTAFLIMRLLRDQGASKEQVRYQIIDWNRLNRPPISENGWPQSQVESTFNFTGNRIFKSDSLGLRALLRNHPVFRTNLLSDGEHRCVISLIALTNSTEKMWQDVTVSPGQLIRSYKSLGEHAHPRSVKDAETVARNAIQKLIGEGVLVKVKQLKNNLGILYEWRGKFAEVFLQAANHPHKSPLQITPITGGNRSISINYDDAIENLITPIDHLFTSSTKSFPPFLSSKAERINNYD